MSATTSFRIAIVSALLLAWELAPAYSLVDPRLVPPPSVVFATLGELLADSRFWEHLGATLAVTAVAFAIAVPLGFFLGISIAESGFASAVFKPLVFFVFSIPKSIFLPLFILAFGISFAQKMAFGVFSTIFVVMMTAFAAVESVRPNHIKVALSVGATWRQIVLRVYLPSMMPILLEAIRLAMIFNFTGILLSEMYASKRGLGNLIGAWGQSFQIEKLMAAVVLIAGVAILFNEMVRALESRLAHWRA